MYPNVCVCFSLEWLTYQLCKIHDRLEIDKFYVMQIYNHCVEHIQTPISIVAAIDMALETIDSPYMVT